MELSFTHRGCAFGTKWFFDYSWWSIGFRFHFTNYQGLKTFSVQTFIPCFRNYTSVTWS